MARLGAWDGARILGTGSSSHRNPTNQQAIYMNSCARRGYAPELVPVTIPGVMSVLRGCRLDDEAGARNPFRGTAGSADTVVDTFFWVILAGRRRQPYFIRTCPARPHVTVIAGGEVVTDSRSGHTLSGTRVPTYDMHGGRPMSPAAVGKEDVEVDGLLCTLYGCREVGDGGPDQTASRWVVTTRSVEQGDLISGLTSSWEPSQ